jgi:hypothetical protein
MAGDVGGKVGGMRQSAPDFFLEHLRTEEDAADGSRRFFVKHHPLGRKCQPAGPKCDEIQHAEGMPNMSVDRYSGIAGKTYVDRVCKTCHRRVMVV